MELGEQRLDEAQLRNMSTVELVRHAMTEMKLLVRAEALHARAELKQELTEARNAGILIGAAIFLAPAGLAIALLAIVLALPYAQWLSALVLGLVVLGLAGLLVALGLKRLPKHPLARTRDRLKLDWMLTREELQ
ncbi:MAG TPA: phage holin family protein [Myxococcaceae bacterium]|nr:phage holin family protein [Myxococcaceae bacterium]